MASRKRKAPAKKAAPRKKVVAKKAAPRKAAPGKKSAPRKPAPRRPAKVKHVPEGYHVVTAYLCIDGASAAIDFYKQAFGARERFRMGAPGGKIGHAEIQIGDSAIMLADEFPDMKFHGPRPGEGTPVNMHLYVPDVDAMMARAIAAGAKVLHAIQDKFYGDRMGTIEDPFGHIWHLATHKEDLSPEEMKRRGEAEHAKHADKGG